MVTLKELVPLTKATLAGITPVTSLLVKATAATFVLAIFQYASTALTRPLKARPAVCALGAPVFPLGVPGAAVSPGISASSLIAAPAPTTTGALVVFMVE